MQSGETLYENGESEDYKVSIREEIVSYDKQTKRPISAAQEAYWAVTLQNELTIVALEERTFTFMRSAVTIR